ncbi:hypothetical protein DFH07DRAFT_1059667 [Mycena maculata]|uniref:HNH nuclease domain-containing protein n=1 Tax=Mycena maculata TaxID=230809 RepID=A0AAD7NII9_9AGAR|nr:hypothetical protein DFH07DRAFT_1059667 [Mycena maculata]
MLLPSVVPGSFSTTSRLRPEGKIFVYHGSYTPPTRIFSLIARRTSPNAPENSVGLPLGLVLDACQILAGDDGYLTAFSDETTRVPVDDLDALLPRESIAFMSRMSPDWKPPVHLPKRWNELVLPEDKWIDTNDNFSALSSKVKVLDARYAVTGATSRLHASHLVPRAEAAWFQQHDFDLAAGDLSSKTVDSGRNVITLRADLNADCSERGSFSIVPYATLPVACFITLQSDDLAYKAHMHKVDLPGRIRLHFLFARFAWTIFKAIQEDLQRVPDGMRDIPNGKGGDEDGRGSGEGAQDAPGTGQENEGNEEGGQKERSQATSKKTRSGKDHGSPGEASEDDNDDASLETTASAPFDLDGLTSAKLAFLEEQDAHLETQGDMTSRGAESHPEVSSVHEARIARMGEPDSDGEV